MFSKKFTIALFFSLPLFWLFFILTPYYLLPSDCFLDNFVYVDNLIQHHLFQFHHQAALNFDDTDNFIYIFLLYGVKEFLNYSLYKAGIIINGISLFLSFVFLARTISSRHSNVNFFIMLTLFLSVQIWAALMGDGILFQGLLYIMIARAFWHKRYIGILIWFVVNTINNPINGVYLFPLIIASYSDILELKERERRRFLLLRLRKTVFWLIIPIGIWLIYRKLYFGNFIPNLDFHYSIEKDSKILFMSKSALYMCLHYIKYFILPLFIGVLFYFIKQGKQLHIKHYAVLLSYIILPIIITSLHVQDQNTAYKNYYIIYLGLLILSFIFIRDFRSITQKTAIGIFIIFYSFNQIADSFIKFSQSYNNNTFRIANDLTHIRKGKIIVYYDNYISYLTNWESIYANGRHQPKSNRKVLSEDEILALNPDIIIPAGIQIQSSQYSTFKVPENTRQYSLETKPENSLDQIFYEIRKAYNVNKFQYFTILVNNEKENAAYIKKVLIDNGSKELKE
ncbi:MAG: hypothetical protein R2760_05075 [Chitinophagales bacterium]